MRKLILSIVLVFFTNAVFAQIIRCAADIKINQNTGLHERINQKIKEITSSKARKSATNKKIRIPIVVHIIHNNTSGRIGGTGNSNISDEQVFSQIEILNQDYNRIPGTPGYNTNPVGSNMEIEFFLANIDPDGKPTTGINRVYSSRRSFNILSQTLDISNLSYWDSNQYLNVWVTTISNGYLGYAEFPIGDYDGLETTDINERIDGVFIDFRAFGNSAGVTIAPYHFGRSATHEIGHWLGLIHTWGDTRCGTDFCDDTPTAEGSNNTLYCTPIFSDCRGSRTQNMIENYMDYTVDSCMNTFTMDQKNRVRAILEISKRRRNLLSNVEIFDPPTEVLSLKILGNPIDTDFLNCKVLVNEAKDIKLEIVDQLGRVVFVTNYPGSLSRLVQVPKSSIGLGLFTLRVTTKDKQVSQKVVSF